jgi:hypothetical protein
MEDVIMRSVSAFALGLVLSVGLVTGSGLVSPASAKEKKKAEEAAKLAPSKEFRPVAVEIQKLIAAQDFAGARAKLDASAALATTPDDKYFLGSFMVNAGGGLKDVAYQMTGVRTMLDSGKAPAADIGKFHFFLAQSALEGKRYDEAIMRGDAAVAANFAGSGPEIILAESYFGKAYENVQGNRLSPAGKALAIQGLGHLAKAIDAEKGLPTGAPAGWVNRGFKMAALAESPDIGKWTVDMLRQDPKPDNWSLALRVIQDLNRNMTRDENLDVLRLMAATGSLTKEYNIGEYLDAAQKGGLLGEIKSVVDNARSAGTIKSTQFNDYYTVAVAAIARDKASLANATSAATGRAAAANGNALLGYGEYAKAATLYRLALEKGGVDANEVNTRLGIALGKAGDAAGAKAAFALVNGGVRKQIADLWVLWLDRKPA